MRRAGQNPTDVEVQDMVNKIDDGSGVLDFEDFLLVMREKSREDDMDRLLLLHLPQGGGHGDTLQGRLQGI